jgi:hypothetical protein
MKIKKTVILPIVPYGYETWPLTLREVHRLRMFQNRVLRKIFGPKSRKTDLGENCIMVKFIVCIFYQMLLG